MVKQWKKSLEQSDILSDGTPFDGANIDAKISEAGVSEDIVIEDSGLFGTQDHFYRELPRIAASTVGTEGSVTPTSTGTRVESGTDTGFGARLEYAQYFNGFAPDPSASFKKLQRRICFSVADTTPFTDRFDIGFSGNTVASDNPIGIDLANSQYFVNSTTETATLPDQTEIVLLTITIDYETGETTFEQNGAVTETKTINDAIAPGRGNIVTCESGNNEEILIHWVRERGVF